MGENGWLYDKTDEHDAHLRQVLEAQVLVEDFGVKSQVDAMVLLIDVGNGTNNLNNANRNGIRENISSREYDICNGKPGRQS